MISVFDTPWAFVNLYFLKMSNSEKEPHPTHEISHEDFLMLKAIKEHQLFTVPADQFEIIDSAEEVNLHLSKELILALRDLDQQEPGNVANGLTYLLCLLFKRKKNLQLSSLSELMPPILTLQKTLYIWQKEKDLHEIRRQQLQELEAAYEA